MRRRFGEVITKLADEDDDIFVIQKNDGMVRLIQNDILQDKPVLNLEVSNYA